MQTTTASSAILAVPQPQSRTPRIRYSLKTKAFLAVGILIPCLITTILLAGDVVKVRTLVIGIFSTMAGLILGVIGAVGIVFLVLCCTLAKNQEQLEAAHE